MGANNCIFLSETVMASFEDNLQALKARWQKLQDNLDIASLEKEVASQQEAMAAADFWQNPEAASISQKHARGQRLLQQCSQLAEDLRALLALAQTEKGSSRSLPDLLQEYEKKLSAFEAERRFNQPYDDYGVIFSISAGAGGTDAQDWAQMLSRMYLRWSAQQKLQVDIFSQTPGEEAGLKSISFGLSGQPLLYGRLKGEHGVHRLVRLSPFNAQNLRQTSFAQVEVLPSLEKPTDLDLNENDLRFDFFKSSGHGGQSVNTTDSAVRVTYLPTQLSVSVQNERSQSQNKALALNILRSKLKKQQLQEHSEKLSDLRGPNQANEFGSQIRNYVLHPYKQVKDLRTKYETPAVQKVLDGDLDELLSATANLNLDFEKSNVD